MWIAGIQPCEHNYLMISYRDSISRKMEFGLDQGHIWTLLLKEEDILEVSQILDQLAFRFYILMSSLTYFNY